jgi:hypothetical protein
VGQRKGLLFVIMVMKADAGHAANQSLLNRLQPKRLLAPLDVVRGNKHS